MSQQIEKRRRKRLRLALANARRERLACRSRLVKVHDIMGNEWVVRRFDAPLKSSSRHHVRERVR